MDRQGLESARLCAGGALPEDTGQAGPRHVLLVLPELLDAEDVKLVSVNVRQQSIGLADGVAIRGAPTVPHEIHTVTWEGREHGRRLKRVLREWSGPADLTRGLHGGHVHLRRQGQSARRL